MFLERGFHNALFGDKSCNIAVGGDINRRIISPGLPGGYFGVVKARNFLGVSLLNRYFIAVFQIHVDRRQRYYHIEWNLVLICQNGEWIGSYFVGYIAVGRYVFGSDKHHIYFSAVH